MWSLGLLDVISEWGQWMWSLEYQPELFSFIFISAAVMDEARNILLL